MRPLRRSAALVAGAIEQAPLGLVVLTAHGAMRSASLRARALLRRYFPGPRAPTRLPDVLGRWLTLRRRGGVRMPLVFRRGEAFLIVRLVTANAQTFLLLEERITALAPEEFHPSAPTPRETDVLVLVAQGHSNAAIAALLDVSPRTVDKHLEQIYARLTLAPRDGAVSHALKALSFLQSTRPRGAGASSDRPSGGILRTRPARGGDRDGFPLETPPIAACPTAFRRRTTPSPARSAIKSTPRAKRSRGQTRAHVGREAVL
jgi:DNA-binding NarL/FixJ family response regulator